MQLPREKPSQRAVINTDEEELNALLFYLDELWTEAERAYDEAYEQCNQLPSTWWRYHEARGYRDAVNDIHRAVQAWRKETPWG